MNINITHWIYRNWRLKLLAVGLAVALLAAVAFSENPVTVRAVDAGINYTGLPSNLELVTPPLRVQVTVIGLAAAVNPPANPRVTVDVDVSHVTKGQNVIVSGTPRVLDPGVNAQTDRVAIPLNVDERLTGVELPIEVRTSVTAGWQVDKAAASPAKVTLAGPKSVLDGLKAFAQLDSPIQNAVVDSPNQQVQFEQNGRKFDLRAEKTIPVLSIDPSTVLLHVEASQPRQTRSVFLSASLSGSPAQGYAVRSVSVDPAAVDISGPGDVISKISTITLSSVSIDGLKDGTQTFRATVLLPDQVDSLVKQARVTVVTYALPAAPTPTPTPTPH